MDEKYAKDVGANSIYHFSTNLMRACWKILSLILTSNKDLEQHHKWNVSIWLDEYSLGFCSNFGMSNGSLVRIGGHCGR